MARVQVQDAPGVAPDNAPSNDYSNVQANPSSFGGLTGQATQRLGGDLAQAGNDATQAAVMIQQRHNEIATNDAFNQFMTQARNVTTGDPNDPTSKGYYALEGRAALDGYQPAAQQIEDARQRIRDGLQNEVQRKDFDVASRRLQMLTTQEMGQHNVQQHKAWGAQVANDQESNNLQEIAINPLNQARFENSLHDARGGRVQFLQQTYGDNVDPAVVQTELAKVDGRAVTSRVQSWAATDPAGAADWLKKGTLPDASGQRVPISQAIDPATYYALTEHLQPKVDRAQAEGVAGAVMGGAGSTGLTIPTRPSASQPIAPEQRQAMLQQATAGTMVPPEVLAGVVAQESSWDQGTGNPVSGMGLGQVKASTAISPGFGLTGINPGDLSDPQKNLNFSAKYLEARGKAAGLTTPADWQDPGKLQAALTGYNGGGDPDYARHVMRYIPAAQPPGPNSPLSPYHVPDLGAQLAAVDKMADEQGLSMDARMHAESLVMTNHSRLEAMGATERENLKQTVSDLLPALGQGVDGVTIPEARIRSAFPPDQANRMVNELQVEQQAGQLMKGLQFAPLDQAMQTVQSLQVPGSIQDGRIVLRRGQLAGQGMTPAAAAPRAPLIHADENFPPDGQSAASAVPAAAEAPENMRLRLQIAQRAQSMLQARQQALGADPAGYAQQSPDVQAKLQAVDPKTPQTLQDYAAASLGMQAQLGVPEAQQRLLTNGQVSGLVGKLIKQDPSQGDTGQQLDAMAQQYGSYWPKVFGEMVGAGKLPAEYQTLAAMDAPEQTVGRQDFQRMLTTMSAKGGAKEMMADLPSGAEQELRQNIDGVMSDFRGTTADTNQGGLQLYGNVRDSVMHLAAYRLATGAQTNATSALNGAYRDVVGAKYDIDGTMRVPKVVDGQPVGMATAQAATSAALAGLQPGDIKQIGPGETPGLTPEDNQAAYLRDVKSQGKWVPNRDDTGLALMRPVRNSAVPQAVLRPDGSPFVLKFADMPRASSRSPASSVDAQADATAAAAAALGGL